MENYQVDVQKMLFSNPDRLISRLKKAKKKFFLKRTTESTQVLFENTMFYFPHSKNFPRNYLFMFKNVDRDVTKWLNGRTHVALPPKHDVTKYNLEYDHNKGEITGADLDHAYWRIAMIKGIISHDTYEKGLKSPSKALRLATLSVLGRKKHFTRYDEGYMGERVCIDEGNENKRMIYKYIRYFCYQMMYECSVLLGDDFDCWKTDCIYYRNTPENISKVQAYFKSKDMLFKQLEY